MAQKVLLIYGTRYGSTEEITEFIAKKLTSLNVQVEVKHIKEDNNPVLNSYDTVVIGSGI